MNSTAKSEIGLVNVITSNNGSLSPEQWAELATSKIISIGNQTDGPIRDQALAYRGTIKKVIEYYIAEAIESHQKHLLARR